MTGSYSYSMAGRRSGVLPAQRRHVSSAVATSFAPPSFAGDSEERARRSAERVERLSTLVEIRKMYRNCLRATYLLDIPSPVYTPGPAGEGPDDDEEPNAEEQNKEAARLDTALDVVAEMQLVAEQLKASLRALPGPIGASVFPPGKEEESDSAVRRVAKEFADQLRERVGRELPALPFPSEPAAQLALDQRNAKYLAPGSAGAVAGDAGAPGSPPSSPQRTLNQRLEQANQAAGQFVSTTIKPALKRARESDIVDLARETGSYLKGLWNRLNGTRAVSNTESLVALGLPLPASSKKEYETVMSALSLDLDALEKRLVEASKARETKLRKAGLQGRVQMAIQLKLLDAEVLALARLAAVRTLQLEMEFIFASLEDEALDVAADTQVPALLKPEAAGSSELALLVAEFTLLDEQLTVLSSALDKDFSSLVGDDLLEKLAVEIPDMRVRVGVPDTEVFGGQGVFSLTKVKLQAKDSVDKVLEGVYFMARGTKMLGSDVGYAGRLFWKAALGGTLKPREVSAIRRTARDLLTFIPFAIILIIPLTPLGHVLVFSFIQRYFPSFFPSQFSGKRQELMMRYEDLRSQLQAAQEQAEAEEDVAELQRAAAAVARLTAPEAPAPTPAAAASGSVDAGDSAPAATAAAANGASYGAHGGAVATANGAGRALASTDASGGALRADVLVAPGGGEAARKVKMLEQKLEMMRGEVQSGSYDEADEEEGESRSQAEAAQAAVAAPVQAAVSNAPVQAAMPTAPAQAVARPAPVQAAAKDVTGGGAATASNGFGGSRKKNKKFAAQKKMQ